MGERKVIAIGSDRGLTRAYDAASPCGAKAAASPPDQALAVPYFKLMFTRCSAIRLGARATIAH